MDSSQAFNSAIGACLRGDYSMMDTTYTVYAGEHFEAVTRYYPHEFKEHWEAGHIIERKMPWPTKKKPERTRTVYYWTGIPDSRIRLHDMSAEMPPCVTELAAEGVGAFVACADAWRGHVTPAFRGLRSIQAVTRLLINPMVQA
jgi:hypothetical protein